MKLLIMQLLRIRFIYRIFFKMTGNYAGAEEVISRVAVGMKLIETPCEQWEINEAVRKHIIRVLRRILIEIIAAIIGIAALTLIIKELL